MTDTTPIGTTGAHAARLRRARRWRDLRLFGRGIRDALVMPAWVIGFSLLGIGSLAYEVGMPFWALVIATPLIWAGPAQFVMLGSLAAGTALLSIALAVSLTSVRLLPMGLSLLPMVARRDDGLLKQAFLAHGVVVTTWSESVLRMPGMARRDRAPWYLGFAYASLSVATMMAAIGFLLSARLPVALATAFLFVTPLFFSITLIAGAKRAADFAALAFGVALLPVATWVVGRDFDLLVTGLVGGTLAYGVHWWRK
jgi:predicted branched-subunit amino acid permease